MTTEETDAGDELEDHKMSRDSKSNRKMWRKLGVSQRIVNLLSTATSSKANTPGNMSLTADGRWLCGLCVDYV